ncbi:MAG: AEC family transporter [Clostridia bacterium]
MEDLLFSLQTVFPLLMMMAVGFAARRAGWVNPTGIRQLNACVFRIFLPLLLCFNIMDTKRGTAVDGFVLLYALLGTLACFAVLFLLVPKLCRVQNVRGVMIQGIARSNYAIFGIPLVMAMYPTADLSIAAFMVVVVVPVFNVLSTIALMAYGDHRTSAAKLLKGILLNPLILGTAAGFLLWQLQCPIPLLIATPLRKLASIATPLALFLLGASLDFGKARSNLRLITIGVVGRLILVPLVFLTGAVALGIRDVSLATLIAVFASPTSVSSFPMAQQMGGNDELAGGQVVFSTVFSILTVFLWVLVLKSFGFLA